MSVNRPLRVLMISPSFRRQGCGIADYTARLVGGLQAEGLVMSVVHNRENGSGKGTAGTIPFFTLHGLREMWSLSGLTAHLDPDLIHIQYQCGLYSLRPWILLLPAFLRRRARRRRPVVVTMHDLMVPRVLPKARPLRRALLRHFISGASSIVVTTARTAAEAVERGVPAGVVHTIPVGSNVEARPPAEAGLSLVSDRYHLRRREHLFLALGLVWSNQGWDLWLKAIAAMDPARRERARFLLVGGSPIWKPTQAPDYHDQLREEAERLGIGSRLVVTGFLPEVEVSSLLHLSDTLVRHVPGSANSGSTTTLAALTHRVPIVAVGDSRFQDPLIPAGSVTWANPTPEALARAMERAVDAGKRQRGQGSQPSLASALSWPAIVQAHLDAYLEVA